MDLVAFWRRFLLAICRQVPMTSMLAAASMTSSVMASSWLILSTRAQVFETVGCVFLLGYAATAWSRIWYAVRAAIGGIPPARAWGLRRLYQTSM